MSIHINKLKCVGCGQCIEACPGNLIKKDTDGKAFIKHVKDCWAVHHVLRNVVLRRLTSFWVLMSAAREALFRSDRMEASIHGR